jgi:hypothetical protein
MEPSRARNSPSSTLAARFLRKSRFGPRKIYIGLESKFENKFAGEPNINGKKILSQTQIMRL